MIRALFAAHPSKWSEYETPLNAAFAQVGLEVDLATHFPPDSVDYIIHAPSSQLEDFEPYTRAKAVLSLWAGVEGVVGNKTLRVPLARMVDPGMTEGMVEWVTGHVLRHHLNIDHALRHQAGDWVRLIPPLARQRTVGFLGLGELGLACAHALTGLGFQVVGWSRGQKIVPGVDCTTGSDGLNEVLSRSEILVLLLPLTPLTRNILNEKRIGRLPANAVVINPGRGPLIDDAALLAALDAGHLGHATLDVFREEPLPRGHPFWAHPKVTVTPHIASETRALTASMAIAENIRRGEAGEPFLHLVDRTAGY